MLWIVMKGTSHQIISCNTHKEGDKYQLWVERPNGKSLKIVESTNQEDVEIVKEAIDYAIKHREPVLELMENKKQ